jgi:hypothetical protein
MSTESKIVKLVNQLYPRGRAFKLAEDSDLRKLHNALSISKAQAFSDAISTLDSALPDNENFSVEDAAAWENRLGLITNDAVSLANRKAAIIRKMNHPGTVPARENYRFLEGQLRLAGFDVYVYENRFDDGMGGYITKSPEELTGNTFTDVQHGDIQHGDAQHGSGSYPLVVNNIDEDIDRVFNIGDNLRSTFYIGGPYEGDYADVDVERKLEFRQIILKIKPVQTVGILLINYV